MRSRDIVVLALVALGSGCGSDDGGGGSGADAGNDSCSSAHSWLCAALHNDGTYGGQVSVQTTGDSATITSNSLADHEMGPYGANPNTEQAQNFSYAIPLQPNQGPTAAGFGHVAVAWNGVSYFNPTDARDIGGCTGNAAFLESNHVDGFGGHPTMTGEYHYHTGDFLKRADDLDLSHSLAQHSPIVGVAFDGLAIYGPFTYSDPNDAESELVEVRSCYRLKTERDCCDVPAQCSLAATFDGKTLVLGAMVEDFEYDQAAFGEGTCHLDRFNSREGVTPEFPEGRRAYFMTFDEQDNVAYPFVFGTEYWGQLP